MEGTTTLLSGTASIDDHWGGFYPGGSYLVVAPTLDTARLLTLRFLQAGAEQGEPCLLLSSGHPEACIEQAYHLGFDVLQARQVGQLTMQRFPPAASLHALDDYELAQTLGALGEAIRAHQPCRVVIDDLLPFVQFRTTEHLHAAFMQLLAHIDPLDATLLMALPEPSTTPAQHVVRFISEHMTGELRIDAGETQHYLILQPRLGHQTTTVMVDLDIPVEHPVLTETSGLEYGDSFLHAPGYTTCWDHATTTEDDALKAAVHLLDGQDASAFIPDLTSRDAFRLRLQQRFHHFAVHGVPFLLIALRGDARTAPHLDISFLGACIRDLLADQDDYLEIPARQRIIAVLDHSTPADARLFFSRLKMRLLETAPTQAEEYLQAVTTVVIPSGKHFSNAEDFLTFALDEP